ncbi:reelin domain-containing protein 1 [Rhinatrema bivittatum]|uniref:reelin domain-containing protein 1 n=1 Tax=Rhinatrema bivittatum TaxID=194408 RepID=UPI001126A8CD|nr:reelin domain-containing protein 1 [Rhinatrema bivittatum]
MPAKVEDGMKIQLVLIGWACMTLCLVSYTAAFSHGASLSACSDMRPKHIRAQPQNLKKNYITIFTNRSFYLPGDNVPVMVRSTRDFMGFLLQARRVSSDEIAGTFIFIPPSSKLLTCFEDGDAVTHSDKSLKRNLSFVWKAPDQPVGDIKFFLSVVQSYFVYWARIESAVISDQTENRTYPAHRNDNHSSTIAPSPLQRPDVNVSADEGFLGTPRNTQASTEALSPHSSASDQRADAAPASLTRTRATEGPRRPAPPAEDEWGAEVTEDGTRSPPLPPASAAASGEGGEGPRGSGARTDRGLEPSLRSEGPGTLLALLGVLPQDEASGHSTRDDRSEGIASFTALQPCSACGSSMSEASVSSSPAVPSPAADAPQLWKTQSYPSPGETWRRVSEEEETNASSRSLPPSSQGAGRRSVTEKASADFLQQSENADSGQAGGTPPGMTGPAREAVAPGKGGEKSGGRNMQLAAAQLGILLGCSAALGMALAAGLRCIHAQYCHKRTEVSFSEPDSNVITVRENGEMMHFRKIRENSFVLVQAEYNWITPAASGKKQ